MLSCPGRSRLSLKSFAPSSAHTLGKPSMERWGKSFSYSFRGKPPSSNKIREYFFLFSTLKASLSRGEGLDVLCEALLHTEAASVSLARHYKDLIMSTSSSPQTSQVMTWSNPWQAHDWSGALVEMSLCQISISAAVSLRMQCTVNYQKSISATFLCTFLISLYSIVNCIF